MCLRRCGYSSDSSSASFAAPQLSLSAGPQPFARSPVRGSSSHDAAGKIERVTSARTTGLLPLEVFGSTDRRVATALLVAQQHQMPPPPHAHDGTEGPSSPSSQPHPSPPNDRVSPALSMFSGLMLMVSIIPAAHCRQSSSVFSPNRLPRTCLPEGPCCRQGKRPSWSPATTPNCRSRDRSCPRISSAKSGFFFFEGMMDEPVENASDQLDEAELGR